MTRQRNAFNALISNYGTYQEALEAEKNSEGSSQRKYDAYKDSIAYQKEQLAAAWEGFVQKLEESEVIKTFFSLMTTLVDKAEYWIPAVVTTLSAMPSLFEKVQLPLVSSINGLKGSIDNNTAAVRGETASSGTNAPGKGQKGLAGLTKKMTFGQAATAGISTGIAYGASGGGLFGNAIDDRTGVTGTENTTDNIMTGVLAGGLAAVGGAVLGPLGTMAGAALGDVLSSVLKLWIHQDDIARKKRVEQVKEEIENLEKINDSLDKTFEVAKKNQKEWDSDDWKVVNEFLEEVGKVSSASEELQEALNKVGKSADGVTKENLAQIKAAYIKEMADKTFAAGEQERADIIAEFSTKEAKNAYNESMSDLKYYEKYGKTKEQEIASLKAAQAELDEFTEALKDSYLEAAFYSSGVASMDGVEIANATLDRVVLQIAESFGEEAFGPNGQILSEIRNKIISDLHENDAYASLFTNETKYAGDLRYSEDYIKGILEGKGVSYDQLKKIANGKNYKDLAGYISELGENSSFKEFAKYIDLINNADPSGIETIAHALNMTADQFREANKNGDFDWLTSSTIINGIDGIVEHLEGMNDVFSEIAINSNLSQKSIENLIKNYRYLAYKRDASGRITGVSADRDTILGNILNIYKSGAESNLVQTVIGSAQSDIGSSVDVYNIFKDYLRGNEADLKGKLGEDFDKLMADSTYKDAIDIFAKNKDLNEKFWEFAAETVGDIGLFDTLRELMTKSAVNNLETEISNLESIKDSLNDVNKQRQKELDLVKAKMELENAQKEKKRVYRAGIGWTYMTDQTAVKEAQEKVDELERQRDQENIQYQIDLLTQQRDLLQNIEENEELKNLESMSKEFFDNMSVKDIVGAILGLNEEEIKGKIEEGVKNGGKSNTKAVINEENFTKANDAKTVFENAYEAMFGEGGTFAPGSAYQKALKNENDVNHNAAVRKYNAELVKLQDLKADYESKKASYTGSGKERLDIGEKYKVGDLKTEVPIGEVEYDHGVKIDYENGNGAVVDVNSGLFEKHMRKGFVGHYILISDGKFKNVTWEVENAGGISKYVTQLKAGETLIHDWGDDFRSDRAIYKDLDGNLRWVNSKDGRLTNRYWVDLADSNAAGNLSFGGGRTFINERGLEGIITPEGTLTSLPAKSGILPADLTKNLWQLGEIAPNLIARLGGRDVSPINNSPSEDNSMHIGTLNATFNTDSGFDSEEFWKDVQSEIILTKNNH